MPSSHFCGPNIEEFEVKVQPRTSVLKIIEETLRSSGDRVALIDGDRGERINSSQLLEQSRRIAAWLQETGVCPGDVVVLCCNKSILAYSLLLGIMFSGATVVLIPLAHADKIEQLTSGHVVKTLLYDPDLGETVRRAVARMPQKPCHLVDINMASTLKPTEQFRDVLVEDVTKHVCAVYFSSGTTGLPKGIEISDLGVQLCGALQIGKSVLHGAQWTWISTMFTLISSFMRKFTLVFTASSDARHRLQIIEKYKVEAVFTNVIGMSQFNAELMLKDYDLSSLGTVSAGGAVILPSMVVPFFSKTMKGRVNMIILYGLTETGVISLLEVRGEESIQLGICGKPMPGVEIKIVDDHENTVEIGTMGKVYVKAPAAKGYWSGDGGNRSFLDNDGFFYTGDSGFFDSEGNLFLRGRTSNLINFRGIKIPPVVLEDLLMGHPAVMDAVVFGKPHPSDIQHLTAFVVLRPEYRGTISEDDIRVYVEGSISAIGNNIRHTLFRLSPVSGEECGFSGFSVPIQLVPDYRGAWRRRGVRKCISTLIKIKKKPNN